MNLKDVEWFERVLLESRMGIDDYSMIQIQYKLDQMKNSLSPRN